MRIVPWAVALVVLALVSPAAAAAAQPRANPISSEPADAKAGESIDIVLTLSGAGGGWNDVAVVIRGSGHERQFPAIALGNGRYRASIAFPHGGGWDVRVTYRSRADGARGEIALGKGGIQIDGPPSPRSERAAPATRPAIPVGALALVFGLSAGGLAVAACRCSSRGSPDRPG